MSGRSVAGQKGGVAFFIEATGSLGLQGLRVLTDIPSPGVHPVDCDFSSESQALGPLPNTASPRILMELAA